MRVDAHHHLWHYQPAEFAWIDDQASSLRRDFLPPEFQSNLAAARLDASVVVQARQSLEETAWLLECAERSRAISGVVGWVPLDRGDEVTAALERFVSRPAFVGAREVLQDKPDGFLMNPALSAGIRHLTQAGLAYDLLVRCSQLEETIRLVDLHPNQRFVLDHAGKPLVAQGVLEPWASSIRDLSQRHNVFCKLSGLTTEANWRGWTEADLKPYLDICIEAFGAERCMAGSDWPVCLVATDYQGWWQTLQSWASCLSREERDRVMGGTATTFYRLRPTVHPGTRETL